MEYPSDSGAMKDVMRWQNHTPSTWSNGSVADLTQVQCRVVHAPHPPGSYGAKRPRSAHPNRELVPAVGSPISPAMRPRSAAALTSYNSLCDHHLTDYWHKRIPKEHARFPVHDYDRGDSIYRVQVITGDHKAAGSDAKLYLTIHGKEGKLTKRVLNRPIKTGSGKKGKENKTRRKKFRFERGTSTIFKFKDTDIGDIKSITIEHSDVTRAGGLLLEQVVITKIDFRPRREKTWVFPCHNWLSLHENDGQIARELYPVASSKTEYEVVCVTGNKKGSGTDANVAITLFGKTGMSPKTYLKTRDKNTFNPGKSDVFKFKATCVGRLSKIRIQHDNEGRSPGWFLERVVVTDLQRPTKWIFYFPCGRWLAKDMDDGAICRDLYPVKHPFRIPKKFRVTLYTGLDSDASTDARVYINIHGEQGSSGEKLLFERGNYLRSGDKDEYVIECLSLGEVKWLRIRHDNSGAHPDWLLDKVIVEELNTDRQMERIYEFPCDKWLSEKRDDRRISRDLYAGHEWGVAYRVDVTTGDKNNAGTSAKIYILLNGKKGVQSEKIWLSGGEFNRGRTDQFNVESAVLVDPLKSLTIGHDNSGIGPGWFLNKVIVRCVQGGYEQSFTCKRWLARDEDDHKIERTLLPDGPPRKLSVKQWLVRVYTSDKQMAGTDSNVAIVVYGKDDKGQSQKTDNIKLIPGNSSVDPFEQGSRDEFPVEMPEIGLPYKMRIWHDNAGLCPGWHLDKVELENVDSRQKFLFPCDRWLANDEDDHSTIREMPAEGDDIKKPQKLLKYKVAVHTGDVSYAGTDANVFLNIFGDQGDTGERPLQYATTEHVNKFERKQVDEFIIEAVNLKRLKKLRIGHDGSKPGAGWFLDKVVITPLSGAHRDKETVFECNRWLDMKEDDGQIVRELVSNALDLVTFNVSVKTGDVAHAGTDANVYLKIFGDTGDTGERKLALAENHKNKFERNKVDEFKIEADDIGKVRRIRIGHDGSKPGSGWYLSEVRVAVPNLGRTYVFTADRWLDQNEEDGKLEVELEPSDILKFTKQIPYNVSVWTGDIRNAGTDANVFIQLYGEEGKTDQYPLSNRTNNFEQGTKETFKLEGPDVGRLVKIRIGHDGAKLGAGWFLDKVLVQRSATEKSKKEDEEGGTPKRKRKSPELSPKVEKKSRRKKKTESEEEEVENYWFVCNKWLASDEGDKQIVRELPLTDEHGKAMFKEVSYLVRVKTGKKFGAGTDANVYMKITGEKGDTGERKLEYSATHTNKFEDGQEDVFTLSAVDLGRIKKVNIRHDNSGAGAAWFLDYVEIDDPNTGKIYKFPCDKWLSRKDGDGEIARVLIPEGKGHDALRDTVTFNLKVKTGDVKSASTDANVYVILFGKNDDSGKHFLKNTTTKGKRFDRGKLDEFSIEAVDIGELEKIKIGHDNKGWGAGWFLDNVIVEAPTMGKRWTFPCDAWLAKDEHDAKLERELYPASVDETDQSVPYEITTYTSDITYAGTDADVYIVLYGKKGSTHQVSLCKNAQERKSRFEQGQEDSFRVELEEVGKIERMRIGHDGSGRGAGWHLDKVEVKRLKGAKMVETYVFPCGMWLASDEGDKAIVRELTAESVRSEGGKRDVERRITDTPIEKTYKIEVVTGDVDKAGTDANVFFTMYGEKGESPEKKLAKSETYTDKFEKGHTDVFYQKEYDLGHIHSVKIRHDNSMFSPSWFLQYIKVEDTVDDQVYLFRCEQWLSKDKGDKQLEKKLFVEGYREMRTPSPRSHRKPKLGLDDIPEAVPYTVRITTGSGKDHGTKARAFICVNGPDRKSTGIQQLELERGEKFEPDSTQTCTFDASDVDRIKSIELGHDGHSAASGWFVEEVQVDMPTRGLSYQFPCHTWLARDKGDRTTKKTFTVAGREHVKKYQAKLPYEIVVYTGQEDEAGTDANILLTVYGEKGETGQIMLDKRTGRFEPGAKDTIKLELEDVGQVTRVRVGLMEGKYTRPSWYLNKIELHNCLTGKKDVFPAETWFSKKQGDKKTSRDLFLKSKKGRYDKEKEYRVLVKTGSKFGAGTDAKVFITMFGERGDTGEVPLIHSDTSDNPFEGGQEDLFVIDTLDIGHIKSLRVWHDNSGRGPGWFLSFIQVQDVTTGVVYKFPCDKWLSKSEDDKLICRDLVCERLPSPRARDLTVYEVTIRTADDADAGMSHDAWLKLEGDRGQSEILHIKNSERNKILRRGQKDRVELRSRFLGRLTRCMVGAIEQPHRPLESKSGRKAQWKCYDVSIKDTSTGKIYKFSCNKWIEIDDQVYEPSARLLEVDEVEDLQKDARDRPSSARTKASRGKSRETRYEFTLVTKEVMYSGKKASVYITMVGDEGDTGRRKLGRFASNEIVEDEHNVFEMKLPDVGEPEMLRIEHDDSGLGASMYVHKVKVRRLEDEQTFTFPCQRSLDRAKEGQVSYRDLQVR